MSRLCVNIDHVATIRQARRTFEPDPVYAAVICDLAGARGITAHLREDRRHIQDRDIEVLRQVVKSKLNLEMAATDEMIKIARRIKPEQVTLVPEKREELTTEGGLNVLEKKDLMATVVKMLSESGICVSLFIDPDEAQIKAAAKTGAQYIEIHTGLFANAAEGKARDRELERIRLSVEYAKSLSLGVNAGHGLNYYNVGPLAAIDEIEEFNIGHSIVAKAVLVGLDEAVREMMSLTDLG